MPIPKRKLGDLGEKIAVDYLKKQGYQILERNFQKPWGEIDIITRNNKDKNKTLIFIEVKTRKKFDINMTNNRHNKDINGINRVYQMSYFPEENVSFQKQQKLIRTAQTYLLEKNYPSETPWQIDVIAVELNLQTRKADLRHIKNAIWQ
jgi:putative endonuclease